MATHYASGLWVGATSDGEPLLWCMTLLASNAFPSAFGGTPTGRLLVGSFEVTTLTLTLRENAYDESHADAIVYRARQQPQSDDGIICFAGTMGHRTFHVLLDTSSEARAGCWMGEAIPSPELAPFCIPTNPIPFSMSFDEGGRAFGGG